jgi:HD-GYP domain-containing protein (c-di-GMP phosphodiesterase class II)
MNSTVFKCEHCESTFATKGNLSYHKKKAKFCLLKRGEELTSITRGNNICEYCEKKFSSKQRLISHKEICNAKNKIVQKENLIKELQDKDTLIFTLKSENEHLRELVESLQDKLASIAIEGVRKTTKITNNTTNTTNNNVTQILSPFDLDQKDILGIIEEKLDETSFLNSQRGIAKFCVDNILKTEDGKMRMVCTDPSRERFKYKRGEAPGAEGSDG